MALSRERGIQFDVYTLFCHYMVEEWNSLRAACDGGGLTFRYCVDRFNESLSVLFDLSPTNKTDAIKIVSDELRTVASGIALKNVRAGEAIEKARQSALANQSSWSYTNGIEACHEQGRTLAVLFFDNAGLAPIASRLPTRATLDYQFGRGRTAQYFRFLDSLPPSPERDRLLELAYENETREKKVIYKGLPGGLFTFKDEHGGYSISVPLSVTNDLVLYVSYPYLFMHEYVAHIFSTDYRNDRFNDGWMLYAADHFLAYNWPREESDVRIVNRAQAYAFSQHLRDTLSDESREHHDYAQEFYDFLLSWAPERFESITFELAAYEPQPGELKNWPTRVLKKLTLDIQAPATLRAKLAAVPTLSDLYPTLKTELPAGLVV